MHRARPSQWDEKIPNAKRQKLDDDFLELDGEPIPANNPPASVVDDEPDPLEAFMTDLQKTLATPAPPSQNPGPKVVRTEYEEDDPTESFLKHRAAKQIEADKRNPTAGEVQELDYDSDDNPIVRKRQIEPLPPVDHNSTKYEEFEKNFYDEAEEIANLSENDVISLRRALDVRVNGADPIRPVKSFMQMGFERPLLDAIAAEGYSEPTPIQKQSIPAALSGRDLIGIAKTGSGKTAAFILPLIVHLIDQRPLDKGEGPIAVVAAPTRELAAQIFLEAKKFCKVYGLRVAALLGGVGKGEQIQTLKSQPHELIICTPGRLIDMIKNKTVKMGRVTFLVLDEADRMFDLGFEPQVRSIVGQIRPNRQTMLFSATFKPAIEQLARDILTDPLKITVGQSGAANEDVTQVVEIFDNDELKWRWLSYFLPKFVQEGSVLIFSSTKAATEELAAKINALGYTTSAIHGDKDMNERVRIMHAFKGGNIKILVATDVAARGLDVKSIKTVVNFFSARDIDSHTHRIGRTGRAGEKGVAYSLLLTKESHFAGLLVKNLESANQIVPSSLLDLALKDPKFSKSRGRRTKGLGGGKSKGINRTGLGFGGGGGGGPKRPGLGGGASGPSGPAPRGQVYKPSGGRPLMSFVAATDTSNLLSSASYVKPPAKPTPEASAPPPAEDLYDPFDV